MILNTFYILFMYDVLSEIIELIINKASEIAESRRWMMSRVGGRWVITLGLVLRIYIYNIIYITYIYVYQLRNNEDMYNNVGRHQHRPYVE